MPEISWPLTAAFSVGFITICFTAYQFYKISTGQNPECNKNDKRISMLENEMKQRNENFSLIYSRLDVMETRVHNDTGKIWAGIDSLKDLIIKNLGAK